MATLIRIVAVALLLANTGCVTSHRRSAKKQEVTPPTAYFFGLDNPNAIHGVVSPGERELNEIGPDRDPTHFSDFIVRFAANDTGNRGTGYYIDGYKPAAWPEKHPMQWSNPPANMVCKLLHGVRHYVVINFSGRWPDYGPGYVTVGLNASATCSFVARPGCEYEARLYADNTRGIATMKRWLDRGKYTPGIITGRFRVEIVEKDSTGRETIVATKADEISAS